jgi:DNA polymerase-3 subunit gamma/tau
LATTDPQKIPVTVLSRCLQFNLKQMPPEAIVDHLTQVLAEENIAGEASALRLLARAAGGSMRDALSLTDQAIAYCAGQVTEDAVRGMLGTIDQRHLVHLLRALAAGRADAVLQVADDLATRGLSYAGALADVASLLARVAVAQRVPSALDDIDPLAADITALAGELHPDLIQLFYSVAVHSRTELALAPDEYAGFVMACLRMLSLVAQAGPDCGAKVQAPPWDNNAAPTQAPAASALASLQPPAVIHPYVALAQSTTPGSSEIPVASPPHGASSESTFDVQPTYVAPAHDGPSGLNEMMADEAQADHASGYVSDHDDDFETVFGLEANGAVRMSLVGAATLAPTSPVRAMRPPPPRLTDMTAEQWPALAAALPVTGLAAELARQCEWLGAADGCVRVRVAVRTLADSASRLRLETVLCEHFGQSLRIEVSVGATSDATAHAVAESVRVANQLGAEEAVAADPFVQTLVADFGAHVVPQSIRHVEQDSRA